MKKKRDYAVYKGDKFIDLGTADELANRLGLKRTSIVWMATPTARKRDGGDKMIVIKIGVNEDE